jgi:hypothetical protein
LYRLEGHNWKWDKAMLGDENGLYAGDEMSAWGTVASVLGGLSDGDETYSIRRDFLKRHGLKPDEIKNRSNFEYY